MSLASLKSPLATDPNTTGRSHLEGRRESVSEVLGSSEQQLALGTAPFDHSASGGSAHAPPSADMRSVA